MGALTVKSANGKQESENNTNEKDLKKAMPITGQAVGSNRRAIDSLNLGVYTVDASAVVESGSDDNIVKITAHGAKIGDVIRFLVTSNTINEFEVHIDEIIDANFFKLASILSADLTAGDTVSILRPVTQRFTEDGASLTTIASAPVSFLLDGVSTSVVEDTVVPGNNTPLPVKLTGVTGDINITAGDLNVQLSHIGVNADVTRIGDGVTEWGIETTTKKGLVKDETAIAALGSLLTELQLKADLSETQPISAASLPLPTGAATAAKQDDIITAISGITVGGDATEATAEASRVLLASIAGEDFATQTTLAALLTELQAKADLSETQPISAASLPLPTGAATEAKQDTGNTSLGNIDSDLGAPADAAVTNPASSASVIAALKGILTLLTTVNTKLDTLDTNSSPELDSTQTSTATSVTTLTPPVGARGMIIQNSVNAEAAIRFTGSGGTPSTSNGFLLGPGQSTSYMPAGVLKFIRAEASGTVDVTAAYFI